MPVEKRGFSVAGLDARTAAGRADALAALDESLRRELGPAYSHLAWEAANFVRALPGKWELSQLALFDDGGVAGFWIASGTPPDAHTHRVAVASAGRGVGIGSAMLDAVLAAARRRGFIRLTLTVNRLNQSALRFYETHGFRRLRGAALRSFLRGRGHPGMMIGDEIEEAQDGTRHRYWAWTRGVEATCG